MTQAVLPQLRTDKIVASPASLDATWVHDPNLLPVEAPYQIQMINAASYVANDLGMKGNSHMFMQDKNNLQVADVIVDWVDKHVEHPKK